MSKSGDQGFGTKAQGRRRELVKTQQVLSGLESTRAAKGTYGNSQQSEMYERRYQSNSLK